MRADRVGSSWPVDATAGHEFHLQLEVIPLRVTLLIRPADEDETTPKLQAPPERLGCSNTRLWWSCSGFYTAGGTAANSAAG